jgi:two-component system, NtrC family, response regulator PilR
MTQKPRCLLVDDEQDILKTMQMVFSLMNPPLECVTVSNIKDAYANLINTEPFDLCITDFKFPDGQSGIELVKHITTHYPHTKVALMTAFGGEQIQVEALQAGAFDYLTKPLNLVYLRSTILNALSTVKNSEIKIIGSSKAIKELRAIVTKYGQTQAPIYINGESGTGKDLVARTIHEQSPRKDKPFVAVNCGAIPPDLMESELFGHKKGSFTGAYADKEGLFKTANGGTLFLDEVADLPINMQVKLLRVLQEREIRPVGATKDIPIDVRIISATNADLEQLIHENKFRKDLFYRLNVLNIHVLPLREHLEDIAELSEQLMKRLESSFSNQIKLTDKALSILKSYDFPGNVRELSNILERAVALCESDIIDECHLQLPKSIANTKIKPLISSATADERQQILEALLKTKGKVKAAADLLNFSFQTMRYRMRKYHLDKEEIKTLIAQDEHF